jgi:hypothetical protein
MEILLGIVSGLFWPVLFVIGIVWFIKKISKAPETNYVVKSSDSYRPTTQPDEASLRAKIATELRAQAGQYTSATQKKVVEDMAQTVEYFGSHGYEQASDDATEGMLYQELPTTTSVPVTSSIEPPSAVSVEEYETPWKKLQVLDGATILLYLGAFFLLASIGLYVGLGVGTTLKALLVSILTIGFYGAGLYLNQYTTRLKPVGATFAAIGMATLPMAGAAIYYFALNKTSGAVVWLVTSIIGVLLYAHAMHVFKSTLVSYMIVFSTLSVVLASISTLGLAPYYFIQGLGFAGIAFVLLAKLVGKNSGLVSEAYERSASFMVPFSVALSVLFVVRVGWVQLAASLLLGAAYYAYLATETTMNRALYVLLAQLLGIKALLSGVFSVDESGLHIAVASAFMAGVYAVAWLFIFAKKQETDVYRRQVKYIYLSLPLLALVALLSFPGSIWWATLALILVTASIYMYERDVLTGIVGSTAVLALPLIISYLALDTPLTDISTISIYFCYAIATLGLRAVFGSRFGSVDILLQQYLYIVSVSLMTGYVVGSKNSLQFAVACIILALFTLQSLIETMKQAWFATTVCIHLLYVFLFIDSPKLILAFTLLHIGYNLTATITRRLSTTHAWIAVNGVLVVPLIYGLTISSPDWQERQYLLAYIGIFVVLYALRIAKKVLDPLVLSYGYLIALVGLLVAGIGDSNTIGLLVTIGSVVVFYISEKVEESSSFGVLAGYLPLVYLFADDPGKWHYLSLLVATTGVLASVLVIRRRTYEAYFASVTAVLSVWYGLSELTSLTSAQKMYIFFALSGSVLLLRLYAKLQNFFVADAVMLLYSLFLGVGVLYLFLSGWFAVAIGLFILGLLLTGISYIEKQPVVIVPALLLGFASVLRLCTGNELSLTVTTALLMILAHSSYWLLVASRLATVRAGFARMTLLFVAGLIPVVGIWFYDNSIFPLSLALFGGMLLRELWSRGQGARELAVLCIHSALLWWLYDLGVRELQVYTQLTALVLAGFAYARRYLQDAPTVINQYLWASVITFTVPMVWQALTSTNPNYSYLLLFEHILLILVSIIYRRSTFAWWGIIVVVASVLYQLRKLRYAALAFLGVFIISLAVYFLLRYNKPDTDKK